MYVTVISQKPSKHKQGRPHFTSQGFDMFRSQMFMYTFCVQSHTKHIYLKSFWWSLNESFFNNKATTCLVLRKKSNLLLTFLKNKKGSYTYHTLRGHQIWNTRMIKYYEQIEKCQRLLVHLRRELFKIEHVKKWLLTSLLLLTLSSVAFRLSVLTRHQDTWVTPVNFS